MTTSPAAGCVPPISTEQAVDLARRLFGIGGTARSLGSHQDRNFRIETGDGPFLLKITAAATGVADLELQTRAAAMLASRAIRVPLARPGLDGNAIQPVVLDGQQLHARLLDFLEGETLSGSGYLRPAAVRRFGELAARIAVALADLDPSSTAGSGDWDLRQADRVVGELLPPVPDDAVRARINEIREAAVTALQRVSAELPIGIIHGDLTDDNVVASGDGIPSGVIDLGDLGVGWMIGELAVTIAAMLDHADGSIVGVLPAIQAYAAIRPLTEGELAALWPLVQLRACVLVVSGHQVTSFDPENSYAAENLVRDRVVFERAAAVPIEVATALFRDTLGRAAVTEVMPTPVLLVPGLDHAAVTILDLSPTSPALSEGGWLLDGLEESLVDDALRAGAAAVVSRFGEPRLTRSRPFGAAAPANVPLFLDITFPATVEVVAPWAGVFAGTVLRTFDGPTLSLEGLTAIADGADGAVGAGEILGTATTLRVRLGDVGAPLFVAAALLPGWRAVVDDPAPLFGLPATDPPVDRRELLARREAHLAEVQEHYYERPPVMVRGWREFLVDADGRVYLDVVNNVTSIGHAHPRLVEAVTRQWQLLNTNSRFHYPAIVEFAERLSGLLPAGLDHVFLVNSGSEAVDLALRIGRAVSGRQDVLAVREAYHGWTDLTDSVSTSVADNPDAPATRPDWVHTVDAPNSYRGRYRGRETARYADDVVAEVRALAGAGTPVGTFVAEAYYGNAGGIALPDGYLKTVYDVVRESGGLCVADEVQVGYGRLGHWFWGFEQQDVVPDIVAVAKAMGNGHPLGAVITTPEIAAAYRSQGYFFSSAGGSPVSAVVGTAVLDVIRDERLQENARDVGGYLQQRLAALGAKHPLVGAAHGSGFYLGLEFVRDRETLEPATAETAAICDRLLERGVIVQPTSDRQCVLKVKPPMCLTRESADFFVNAVDEVLTTGW